MTKLIGITSSTLPRTKETQPRTYVNTAYPAAFTRAGCTPVVLPTFSIPNRELIDIESFATEFGDHFAQLADSLGGLVLSGGIDINPIHFHVPNTMSSYCDTMRDFMELALIDTFVKAGKPILGICRGHQMLLRYLDAASFCQNLSIDREEHNAETHSMSNRQEAMHKVVLFGALRDYYTKKVGRDVQSLDVNSWHHQGYQMGKPTKKSPLHEIVRQYQAINQVDVLACSPIGAILEAFAKPDHKMVGTQWHIEEYGPTGLVVQFWLDSFVE